jgi:hypothetical protein
VHCKSYVEQTYWRPSSPDPPGATHPLQCHTLLHESPDPSGDPISAPEADAIHGRADAPGRTTPRARSVPHSSPPRRTSLLGGPPSDPWEGHYRKTRSPVGYIHAALSALMDPLHQGQPLTAMLIHPCSHARRRVWRPTEIHHL